MLILTRNIGEMVCIGDEVKVTILGVRGQKVRMGIDAPRSVVVDREEIRERRIAENINQWATDGNGSAVEEPG